MFCEKCGTKLPEGSRFCMNCGAKAADEAAVQETAAQEAAISVDSPVMETESAAVEEKISEIPEVKPSLAQDVAPEPEKVQENTAQAPIQPIWPMPEQPIKAQVTSAQTITAQAAQPKPAPMQQASPQPVPKPQASVQAPAGNSAQIQQTIPFQAADARYTSQQALPIQSATAIQQAEAAQQPEKIKPLHTLKFVGMLFITAIPVINLIMVLIWSFRDGFNKNTRSFARATLILWIAELILLIVVAIMNWALISYILTNYSSLQISIM